MDVNTNMTPSETPLAMPAVSTPMYTLATEGNRLLNYLIDLAIINVINFVIGLSFAPITRGEGISTFISYVISFCVFFMYYFLFEGLTQRTAAKFITKTKVVMVDGTKPSLGTIALRTLSRFVPFEPISAYSSQKELHTWWHDRWVNARVIKD
jgi:uncharacterized RDD family membrane protein YckC